MWIDVKVFEGAWKHAEDDFPEKIFQVQESSARTSWNYFAHLKEVSVYTTNAKKKCVLFRGCYSRFQWCMKILYPNEHMKCEINKSRICHRCGVLISHIEIDTLVRVNNSWKLAIICEIRTSSL